MSEPADRLPDLVDTALRAALRRDPVEATYLGDHSGDRFLPDPSADAAQDRARELRALSAELNALNPASDPLATSGAELDVDAAVLRTVLAAELLDLDAIVEDEWNPMRHNPGPGLHALLSRDFAPLPDRLAAAVGRLTATPDYLAAARERLTDISAPHLDTAVGQLAGTLTLIDELVAAGSGRIADLEDAAARARAAIEAHRAWLARRRDAGDTARDARLGLDLFATKLALTLDTETTPERLLHAALADLDRVSDEIRELAGRIAGTAEPDDDTVRTGLDRRGRDAPHDATILGHCRDALVETTAFVRDHDLVTVYDDPIVVVEMPEIDRGIAAAYCRPNGPLEPATLPTEMAVSPTPADWDVARVRSFYREYNTHMLHNLTVHEAMPGHALQLMHANRHRAATPVRAVWWSGPFVEGWAVYAEELLAARGYRTARSAAAADAVRMQQLKMQLRMILNAVLDIRHHCHDLDEAEAMRLMTRRGYQEDGEAAGKWRRVQLTSTQLCTYYVGYREVRALADDLRVTRPDMGERERHDALLAHGSPPPRHLRRLLGLATDA